MDFARARQRLAGCYITIPTMFQDPDMDVNLPAIRRHAHWLMSRGIDARYGTFLAGGAAGDFSTLTFDERVRVAETVVEAAAGKVPVAMGAQTTSTMELRRLAKQRRGWAANISRSAARSTSSTPRRTSTSMSARRPTPPTLA